MTAAEPFRYYLRVRYGECDAQKVVFNARYAEYVDVATNEFFRALGFEAELQSGALDFQLVKQTIEWHAAARFDQVLELAVHSTHQGTTSFHLRTEICLAGEPTRLIASAETIYVLVDDTLRKTPLARELREALELGAPGVVTDHAAHLSNPTAN